MSEQQGAQGLLRLHGGAKWAEGGQRLIRSSQAYQPNVKQRMNIRLELLEQTGPKMHCNKIITRST